MDYNRNHLGADLLDLKKFIKICHRIFTRPNMALGCLVASILFFVVGSTQNAIFLAVIANTFLNLAKQKN